MKSQVYIAHLVIYTWPRYICLSQMKPFKGQTQVIQPNMYLNKDISFALNDPFTLFPTAAVFRQVLSKSILSSHLRADRWRFLRGSQKHLPSTYSSLTTS